MNNCQCFVFINFADHVDVTEPEFLAFVKKYLGVHLYCIVANMDSSGSETDNSPFLLER